ncbi:MAG TPA: class I SAM-dependent methyltransferase [Bacteroidia bacterium]
MKRFLREVNSFTKGLILFLRPGAVFSFLAKPFLFFSNLLSLTKWVAKQNNPAILNDFYKPFRNHSDRIRLYESIAEKYKLSGEQIEYLEFGVYKGESFRWWVNMNKNAGSRFYGFDTFEGLPESWGTYGKGDMSANLPSIDDGRIKFVKGLFQDTLFKFLDEHKLGNGRMVIHIDADLFSSTLFALTTLARFFKSGDIIIFDEFNVPNHEYFAFKVFTESFYVKYELIGAVNNYYQCAFRIL